MRRSHVSDSGTISRSRVLSASGASKHQEGNLMGADKDPGQREMVRLTHHESRQSICAAISSHAQLISCSWARD